MSQGHSADGLSDDGLSDAAVPTTPFRQRVLFDEGFSADRFSDDGDYSTTVFPSTSFSDHEFFRRRVFSDDG